MMASVRFAAMSRQNDISIPLVVSSINTGRHCIEVMPFRCENDSKIACRSVVNFRCKTHKRQNSAFVIVVTK
jgi:hypothetical protein